MDLDFAPLNDLVCRLGEGPTFDDRRNALWYCDIVERAIHRHDLAAGALTTFTFPSEVGSFGLAESGRLVVALRHEVGLFDPADGRFTRLAAIEEERGADTRLNDGKVGPDGAFWVGTMDDRDRPVKEPIGALYRVDASGRVEKKVEGLIVSNGLAFAPDGRTMFHSDSRGRWIDRWDLDPATGAISGRRRLAMMEEATGRPDGGATDAEGCYWSAGVSAARLNRFAPDGALLAVVPVPVAGPTMPCFGGPGLKRLFVTSLRVGRAPELLQHYPLTGRVVVADSPVAGAPVARFADV
jgi:sugar lactone lactonase YvrE